MAKNELYLSAGCVSDIHLGHKKTRTADIISNLDTYLTNDKVFKSLDVLFLAGDVFDDVVSLSRRESNIITSWIYRTILLSIKHKVAIRVLEGTPSHDRAQSKHFETKVADIFESSGVLADVKYIDTLSVEQLKIGDKSYYILYVPDELGPAQQTLERVDELLLSRDLSRFDIAVMHGTFDFQNPIIAHHTGTHRSQEYLNRCKLVFIGHEHNPKSLEHIHAQGSFDRLEHGQEHPKGYLKAKIYPDGHYEMQSVHNKGAIIYKTIICRSDDIENEYRKVEKAAFGLVDGSHVCIQTTKQSPMAHCLPIFENKYPLLHWKVNLKDDSKAAPIEIGVTLSQDYTPIVINEYTLLDLVMQQASYMDLSADSINNIILEVKEVM